MKEISSAKASVNTEPVALSHQSNLHISPDESFSINCLLRSLRVENSASLLSRVNYCFPPARPLSVSEAIRHVECLSSLLVHSKVYVVKDIDGDTPQEWPCHRGHFLQMDSILKGDCERGRISLFLKGVTEDVEVLLKYFQKETYALQSERLSAVAQRCNTVGLRASVTMVA